MLHLWSRGLLWSTCWGGSGGRTRKGEREGSVRAELGGYDGRALHKTRRLISVQFSWLPKKATELRKNVIYDGP